MRIHDKETFAYCRKIFFSQFAVAIVICIIAILVQKELFYSWVIGCCVALFDTGLVLHGVYKGMKKDPEAAVLYMRKTMLQRVALVSIVVLVMLKLKLSVIGVFLSFILLHIFFVFKLIIIASRDKTKQKRP